VGVDFTRFCTDVFYGRPLSYLFIYNFFIFEISILDRFCWRRSNLQIANMARWLSTIPRLAFRQSNAGTCHWKKEHIWSCIYFQLSKMAWQVDTGMLFVFFYILVEMLTYTESVKTYD